MLAYGATSCAGADERARTRTMRSAETPRVSRATYSNARASSASPARIATSSPYTCAHPPRPVSACARSTPAAPAKLHSAKAGCRATGEWYCHTCASAAAHSRRRTKQARGARSSSPIAHATCRTACACSHSHCSQERQRAMCTEGASALQQRAHSVPARHAAPRAGGGAPCGLWACRAGSRRCPWTAGRRG